MALYLMAEATHGQSLGATLMASGYNGYNISCFGKQDGSLTVVPTGGTPPYTYSWTTGATTASITDLPAGYYKVAVMDAVNAEVIVDITLTEPLELKLDAIPYTYANGMNLSCHNCSNGLIDVSVFYGVPPYSYAWGDGASTQDRSNLETGSYKVTVTDANQCSIDLGSIFLQAPERTDWTMTGNANTNPATQYIGTSDNKDVVFKANGQESVRLKANGDISLFGSMTTDGPLFRGGDGVLRGGDADEWPEPRPTPCASLRVHPYWKTNGNAFTDLCLNENPKLGTLNAMPLVVVTHGLERLRITHTGKVGIGTSNPLNTLAVSSSAPRNGIDLQNVTAGANASSEIRFMKNGAQRWGIGSDFSMNGGQDLYIWDHTVPAETEGGVPGKVRFRMDDQGRVAIGDVSTPTGYRLYVQDGILTERVKVAVRTEADWEDRVFAPGYHLMPLPELKRFLERERHLPDVPSAAEMVSNGLDVAKSDAMLLKKIEELYLHMIRIEERMVELEKENEELRALVGKP